MGDITEPAAAVEPRKQRRARYIFQVQTGVDGTVLRVLDTASDRVFREIPIREFLDYARENRDVTPFLMGHLPAAVKS